MNQITGATKACTWGCRHVTPSAFLYLCGTEIYGWIQHKRFTSFSEVSHFDYCKTQGKRRKKKKLYEID